MKKIFTKLFRIKLASFFVIAMVLVVTSVYAPIRSSYAQMAQRTTGSFIVNLLYEKGQLIWMSDDSGIEASPKDFVAPFNLSYRFHIAELYDINDKLLIKSNIDQKGGKINTEDDEVSVVLPFHLETAKIIIRDDQGRNIVSNPGEEIEQYEIPVLKEYFCNGNRICEGQFGETTRNCSYDCPAPRGASCNNNKVCENSLGENQFTCVADCGSSKPTPVVSSIPSSSEGSSGSIIGAILYIVGGLALAGIAWWLYNYRKNNGIGL